MSPLKTGILLVTSALIASISGSERENLQFVTSGWDGSSQNLRSQQTTSLYKAPTPYRSPGRPLLNSFIVTSRPLDLNKESHRKVDASDEGIKSEAPDGYRYIPQYSIECDSRRGSCSETITTPSTPTTQPTFKPYTPEMIERFMQDLDEEEKKNGGGGALEESEGVLRSEDDENQHGAKGSKANLWYRPSPHRPPENDEKGWVALDPVPWSSSKISKWTADKHNPGSRPPEATSPPIIKQTSYSPGQGSYLWHGPSKPHRPHDSYLSPSSGKPIIITDGKDPEWPSTHAQQRPGYHPEHRPEHRPEYRPQTRPDHRPDYYTDHRPVSHRPHSWGSNQQKDGPPYRRPQNYPTPVVYHDAPSPKPLTYGGDEGGQWVIFSDTKEYKPTSDRRSYGRSIQARASSLAKSASGKRTVRLTVLPSTGNFTTSHGGMLEVDGSVDTVDEDRRKRRQLMLANKAEDDNANQKSTSIVIRAPVSTAGQMTGVDRARTVMAAVGAGMVPATMAVLMPMVLAQRGRRSVQYSTPSETRTLKIYNRQMNLKTF